MYLCSIAKSTLPLIREHVFIVTFDRNANKLTLEEVVKVPATFPAQQFDLTHNIHSCRPFKSIGYCLRQCLIPQLPCDKLHCPNIRNKEGGHANVALWSRYNIQRRLYQTTTVPVGTGSSANVFETDVWAEQNGHFVLRSLVKHCDLNVIDLICADVNGRVTKKTRRTTLNESIWLSQGGFYSEVDQAKWVACARHSVGIEGLYRTIDKVQDECVIPPVVINLGESNSG